MIVLNLVHETVRRLYVVAEEFKYSHMKQNFYSSFSILRHLNSLFNLLKGILAKLYNIFGSIYFSILPIEVKNEVNTVRKIPTSVAYRKNQITSA